MAGLGRGLGGFAARQPPIPATSTTAATAAIRLFIIAHARARSRSPPTGFRLWGIHRHCRNEAIPVRHFDLRQTLGVQDVVLLDDAVPIEQNTTTA